MLLYDFNQEVYENVLREEGREEGREEIQKKFSKIIGFLFANGRIGDIKKAGEDNFYFQQLCKEFNI